MEINQQELERRLKSSRNLSNILGDNKAEVPMPAVPLPDIPIPETPLTQTSQEVEDEGIRIVPIERKHRPPANVNMRILAGSLAKQGVSTREIAQELDLTVDQVLTAKNTKNPEVAGPREDCLGRVREIALEKTMAALNLMTPDKFANASLKDLALVASQTSRIIQNTTPTEETRNIQLVVYSPKDKSEKNYRTIDV